MNKELNLKLNARLQLCADFVKLESRIADIGTDHAYLPIWLAKNNLITHAIAADIKIGPLSCAQNNINKYKVSDIIETRISDGLLNISENEVDEIIIAGMGGGLIYRILEKSQWILNSKIQFILQPMQTEEDLRRALPKLGLKIKQEKAVGSEGKIYTVMKVCFSKEKQILDETYPYIGKIMECPNKYADEYIQRQLRHLSNKHTGFISLGKIEKAAYILNIIRKLELKMQGVFS